MNVPSVSSPPKTSRPNRSRQLALLALVVGALALRCVDLGRFGPDNDEVMEIQWSRLPIQDLLSAVGRDGVHPPLDYLVQSAIGRIGGSDWGRRVPSVLAGTATVALIALLGIRWFGLAGGLSAGLFLAYAPVHVRFSQEIRPYALGLLFLTASVASLEEYRRRPSRLAAATWFASVIAAAYTLYFAGLIAGVLSVLLIGWDRNGELRPLWRRLPMVVLGWLLLYSPWLPFVVAAARTPPRVEREVLDTAWVSHRLQVLGTGDWRVESVSPGSWAFWLLVLFGFGLAWRSPLARWAGLWLSVGSVLELLVLQALPHYPAARHFLPAWLAAPLLAGYAVSLLWPRRATRAIAVLAVLLALFFDGQTLLAYYDHGRPEWDAVARYLRRRIGPGERLIVPNNWTLRNLGYYWSDEGLGRPGVSVERASAEIVGPSWFVIAVCPMSPSVRARIDRLELVRTFPMTNHCEIRFLPARQRLSFPEGICRNTE